MDLQQDPRVSKVFDNYSDLVRKKILFLRELILETASGIEGLNSLEETLKWGEPSYLTKHGSTIRINRKKGTPEQYAIYFKCTSKLVVTFKEVYGDQFNYETTRAIVFKMDDEVPTIPLKHCISLALTYHKVKHLPLLGASREKITF